MQAFLQAGACRDGFDRPTLVNTALDTPRDRPILAVDLAPAPGDLPRVWQEIYWHPRLLGAFLAPSVDATTDEIKRVYQPVLIERRRMSPGDVAVRVTNRHHHLSLEDFEPRWAVLRDGEAIQQGVLAPLALPPNAQPEVLLPVAPIDSPVAGATYTLRLSFHTRVASAWAPAGHEIAREQLPLDVAVPASSAK
jgi:beta-galactosidase